MPYVWAVMLLFSVGAMAKEEAPAAEGHGGETAAGAATSPSVTEAPAINQTRAYSPAELEILQDLEARRTELDRREQALELREKLVDLMEKRLQERVTEMTTLKAQLEELNKGLSGKDDAELNQLSQIYGSMKPAVAAGVMNRLDNSIVFDVLKRMPTKKSGKIMEALDPVKARVISEMMAEKDVVLGTDAKPSTPENP